MGAQTDVDFLTFRRLGLMLEVERVNTILAGQQDKDVDDGMLIRLAGQLGPRPLSFSQALTSEEGVKLPHISLDAVKRADKHSQFGFLSGVGDAREFALLDVDAMKRLPIVDSNNAPPGGRMADGTIVVGRASGLAVPHTRTEFLRQLRQVYTARSSKNQDYYSRMYYRSVAR